MPEYIYECYHQHRSSVLTTLAGHKIVIDCPSCGAPAPQVITAPLLVKASQDVCYDSPIDGRPITNWQARQEDLKRNGCREYDPEMKRDFHQRLKDSESALDKTVDTHVEASIEKMPTKQRAKLYSELTQEGVSAEVVRSTPHA